MKILGIDHATIHAGMAFLENGVFTQYKPINLKGFDDITPMHGMFNAVTLFIKLFRPDLVALEKPMALRNGDVARKLIEVYAACKLAAEHNNTPVLEITPQLAKMYTAGHAGAEKDDVARSLEARFGLNFDDIAIPVLYKEKKRKGQIRERLYDVSDACAICVAASEIKAREMVV